MTANDSFTALIEKTQQQLLKSLNHLEYSYSKIKQSSAVVSKLSEEDLEAWEGFLSRFARSADLFVSKYLRLQIQRAEQGFRGSTRDLLNLAEKMNLIESANTWLEIRELRNRQAHEYEEEDLQSLFEDIRMVAPHLLSLKKNLQLKS